MPVGPLLHRGEQVIDHREPVVVPALLPAVAHDAVGEQPKLDLNDYFWQAITFESQAYINTCMKNYVYMALPQHVKGALMFLFPEHRDAVRAALTSTDFQGSRMIEFSSSTMAW